MKLKSDLIEIYFYFPKIKLRNKQELVDLIMKSMRKNGTIQYSGCPNEKILKESLLNHLGQGSIRRYRPISDKEQRTVRKIINEAIQKSRKLLPIPTKNYIFVFPWFPSKKDVLFNGSYGFAPYSCVLHLFIGPDNLVGSALADSVVHEITHTISFFYHFERYGKWSLLDHIINEGLAENFREDVLNTKPAPWAIALTKKEAFSVLVSIKSLLNSKSYNTYQKILFGNRKYKRWARYSIGYWLVKEFIKKNKKLSWEEIVKTTPENILKSMIKK